VEYMTATMLAQQDTRALSQNVTNAPEVATIMGVQENPFFNIYILDVFL